MLPEFPLRSAASCHLPDTGKLGGVHHSSGAHRLWLCFATFAQAPRSAHHTSGDIVSSLAQFRESSFAPRTRARGGLAQERWLCRPAMPPPHGSWPRQHPGYLLPAVFARLCVVCLATSYTSLPLCRYHGFRCRPLISPDAVLMELNWFRDLSRTRIGAPVCPESEVDRVKPPRRGLWHRDHPR